MAWKYADQVREGTWLGSMLIRLERELGLYILGPRWSSKDCKENSNSHVPEAVWKMLSRSQDEDPIVSP